MFDVNLFLLGILQAVFVVLAAPLLAGFARVLRAKMHSRTGPPILQYYYDLWKLLKRQDVSPAPATWVYRLTPYIVFSCAFLMAMIIPMVTLEAPLGYTGDLIVVIYLLAAIRFFTALSGIDSGSGFAGVGSIRELALSVLVEPALILVLLIMALFAGSTNLGAISLMIAQGEIPYTSPAVWLGMAALAVASFVEMGKLPFDLAEAEQELQEGPLTEYSGRRLAVLEWGLFMKQLVVASLFLAVFFPFGSAVSLSPPAVLAGLAFFLVKLAVCYFLAAVVENSMCRLTIYKAPGATWVALGIALLSFVFYLVEI
ncbi:MAG: hydrogenase-4 component [Clostridia bacterium]|nr:hydrogenase-4 component [Clostridia bacterium]